MELRPESLTWTGLLAQWVRFAQASLAIPDQADGPQWRASVPAIITLQAVTFALGDLDRLAADERSLALDMAELLINENTRRLNHIWAESPMSAALIEIIEDAHTAAKARRATSPIPPPDPG